MGTVAFDRNGIELADVPDSGGVSVRKTGSKGGNPRHDSRSGKFTEGSKSKRREPPPNTDPLEYARMIDAVRDAAREFDMFDEGDIREFLQGRAKAPDQVDIQQFMNAVTEQRMTDIVDILDQQLRSGGSRKRGRRKVRVAAPKGFLTRALRQLDGEQVAKIMHRLEAMGHDPDDVDRFFDGRIKVVEEAREKRAAINASDAQFYAEGGLLTRSAEDQIDEDLDEDEAPVVNIFVTVPSDEMDADQIAQKIRSELADLGKI